jgi:hypothetical protein
VGRDRSRIHWLCSSRNRSTLAWIFYGWRDQAQQLGLDLDIGDDGRPIRLHPGLLHPVLIANDHALQDPKLVRSFLAAVSRYVFAADHPEKRPTF